MLSMVAIMMGAYVSNDQCNPIKLIIPHTIHMMHISLQLVSSQGIHLAIFP